jgi:hypothetical protein
VEKAGSTILHEPLSIQAAFPSSIEKSRSLAYGAAALLLVLTAVVVYRLIPSQLPRVLGLTELTHDGLFKFQLSSDGERLYIVGLQGGHVVVSQVSVAGGETIVLPTPFANVLIEGITPDGSALVVSSFEGTSNELETWSPPLPNRPPRRMGDLRTSAIAWSPDGKEVVFSNGSGI